MEYLKYIPLTIDLASMAILLLGILKFLLVFIRAEFRKNKEKDSIRIILGHYILIALELMIASDVIHTLLDPTRDELIELGAIVLIRTVISYFLSREIKEFNEEISLKTQKIS